MIATELLGESADQRPGGGRWKKYFRFYFINPRVDGRQQRGIIAQYSGR